MEDGRRGGSLLIGAVFSALGGLLLAFWIRIRFGPPLVEPADPGRIPVQPPFWVDFLAALPPAAYRILLPASAVALLVAGVLLISRDGRGRNRLNS